ncbi:hypothetical protein R3X25_12410 [Lutibacter sp. TH_r2]|uniref:hypothetical protein n=1 Tax=Lutibacter sp. TH_r2 TaxID=3082083 RepID=UPI0029533D99|nr:hypothetical protein [Lutibacter sp. TH_r2]MDV7188087.1 hypothetical protein [Lutibacter sp. TH_r2]
MKKILIYTLILLTFITCSEGDIDIPTFDFEDTITSCDDSVFYITNDDETEALVLTLSDSDFEEVDGNTETISISTSNTLVYRIFESEIDSDYFCQDVPPTTPSVLKEYNAESGYITITTTETTDFDEDSDDIVVQTRTFEHEITFQDLVLYDEDNTTLTFETFDFGEITTTYSNSSTFDFIDETYYCGEYTIYQTTNYNYEAIVLTLTSNDITTNVGETTYILDQEDRTLFYRVFDGSIDENYFCSSIPASSPSVEKELFAKNIDEDTDITITINTSLGTTANANEGYTYLITVCNFMFVDDYENVEYDSYEFSFEVE